MATLQSKRIALFLLVFALFLVSYTRDTLFIVLNAVIDNDPNNYANTTLPDYLKKMQIADIKKLKWLFAILFSALFMLITTIAVHLYFNTKQLTRIAIGMYVLLGISAIVAELINHFLKLPINYFNLVHIPETLVQSPLLALLFFAAALVFKSKSDAVL